jgi:hypothetical protein
LSVVLLDSRLGRLRNEVQRHGAALCRVADIRAQHREVAPNPRKVAVAQEHDAHGLTLTRRISVVRAYDCAATVVHLMDHSHRTVGDAGHEDRRADWWLAPVALWGATAVRRTCGAPTADLRHRRWSELLLPLVTFPAVVAAVALLEAIVFE